MKRKVAAAIAVKKIPVVKFGRGFPIVQEDKKVVACREWKQLKDHYSTTLAYDILEPGPVSFMLDGVEIRRGGLMFIPRWGGTGMMMYETAFQQLLSTLELPNSIAERLPVDVLIQVLKGLLADNFTRNATIKASGGHIFAFGYTQAQKAYAMSAYRLFEYLNSKDIKTQHKYDFLFGVSSGFKSNLIMKFADYRDKPIGGAVEVLFSEAMDCKPRVTGLVTTPKGHIFIRNLSFVMDTDDQDTLYDMTSSFITRISSEIGEYVKKAEKLDTAKLTADAASKLKLRASKCIKHTPSVALKLEAGMTLSAVLDALQPHREALKNSLLGKRDIAYFANDVLTEVCP
jgi:hypothetical protein